MSMKILLFIFCLYSMDIGAYKQEYYNDAQYQYNGNTGQQQAIWPAIIAAAGALGSAAVNFFGSKKSNQANKEINQSQLEYAQQAFEREKEYNNFLLGNSQQMKMADAKAAGINPAFGQGSMQGASIAPSMNLPSQIPMNYNFDSSGIATAARAGMDMLLGKAQIDKFNAEKDLTVAQKDRQLIENQILPALLKSEVQVRLSNVEVNGSNIDLSKANGRKIAAEIESINKNMQVMDATVMQIQQNVKLMKEEERIKAATAAFQSEYMQAQISEIASRSHLERTQARDIAVTQMARLFNIQADTLFKGAQTKQSESSSTLQGVQAEYVQQQTVESRARTSNIAADTNLKTVQKEQVYWNVQQNKLDFEIDRDFKRTERSLQMAKTTAETARAAAEAAKTTVDLVKPWN